MHGKLKLHGEVNYKIYSACEETSYVENRIRSSFKKPPPLKLYVPHDTQAHYCTNPCN